MIPHTAAAYDAYSTSAASAHFFKVLGFAFAQCFKLQLETSIEKMPKGRLQRRGGAKAIAKAMQECGQQRCKGKAEQVQGQCKSSKAVQGLC